MKSAILLIILMHSAFSEHLPSDKIIGVWEMTAVNVPTRKDLPSVALTNKKDIYTKDGVYHNTAANGTKTTDADLRKYTIDDTVITLISNRGERKISYKFISDNKIVLTEKSGTEITFSKISSDAEKIPFNFEREIVPTVGKK